MKISRALGVGTSGEGSSEVRRPPELPVLLIFLISAPNDLELIFSLSFSSSKCCFGLFGLSWTKLEQVCKIFKTNLI